MDAHNIKGPHCGRRAGLLEASKLVFGKGGKLVPVSFGVVAPPRNAVEV